MADDACTADEPVEEPTADAEDDGQVVSCEEPADQTHPDVVDAEATTADDGTYTFDVTVCSPYDTPERYADAWRITDVDDSSIVCGERILQHDHQNEQPFTRDLTGVEIPDDVDEVLVEARDSENGYGGETATATLPD